METKNITEDDFVEMKNLCLKYHPDNIPKEILDSKDVILSIHTHFDDIDTPNKYKYIWSMKPSNTRKNTVIRLNNLIRKYDYPTSASAGVDENENYNQVSVDWKLFYRYVNGDGDILKCCLFKNNKHLEITSRLDGPCTISINERLDFNIKTFFYIPDHVFEVGLTNEYLTKNPGTYSPRFSNVGSDQLQYMFYIDGDKKQELLLKTNYWSSRLYSYDEVFGIYKHRVSQLVGVEYDTFVIEYKLDKLDI